jgi:hypothetical protein
MVDLAIGSRALEKGALLRLAWPLILRQKFGRGHGAGRGRRIVKRKLVLKAPGEDESSQCQEEKTPRKQASPSRERCAHVSASAQDDASRHRVLITIILFDSVPSKFGCRFLSTVKGLTLLPTRSERPHLGAKNPCIYAGCGRRRAGWTGVKSSLSGKK